MLGTKITSIMDRIIKSKYNSIEPLVEIFGTISMEELRIFLKRIMKARETNEITQAAMHVLLKFVHIYLDQPKIQIDFKNQISIPICYFSSFLLLSASLLYSYLKTLSFAVALFPLDKTEKHLRAFLEKERPHVIIFTLSQFLYVEALMKIVPYLHKRKLKIFIGGIPFMYEESLKGNFPNCYFPQDISELGRILQNFINEGKG